VFSARLADIVPLVRKDSVVVDVATVKEHTAAALAQYKGRIRYVAAHPMFGPFSYEKKGGSVEGLRLVISEHTLTEDEMNAAEVFLSGLGLVMLHLSPESHDRMLAETLFLTHFLAQGVVVGGFKRTHIDTVSFGFLMDAVESVKHDTALFLDVYRYNRYCKAIPGRITDALARVAKDLEAGDTESDSA
jgi:prephenate dehydrogenase